MNKTLRTKSSNNRISGLLMIMTLGVLMMTANSAITAQTFKNELLGTWVGVDKPKNKITFAADELTSLEDGAEHKVKYTRLSNDEIQVELNGRVFQIKTTFEGEVLTMKSDNQPPTKFRRESSGSTMNKAQPFKNELIGTWRVEGSRKMATFTADEVKFYRYVADLDEGRGPDLEEEKFKYTHLSNNEIKLTSDGKISQMKTILEGEVLIMINDKGLLERYKRESGNAVKAQPFKNELIGDWVEMVDPKDKITFTADEFTFPKSAIDGKYTHLSNDEIKLDVDGRIVQIKVTVEGELLTMIAGGQTVRYKRETTNAANSNANANTTAQTAPIDYQKFKELSTRSGHSEFVTSVAFSPDGKTLASGGYDNTIKLWNVADGTEIKTLAGNRFHVNSVAFSPDGKTLASGDADMTIKLWNVADGKEVRTLSGHQNHVQSVAFSPDGKTLASGSANIKLWNVADGKELRILYGDSATMISVAFSPDGKTLAGGSGSNRIKLWNVADGKELSTFLGHSGGVFSVAFSPDGKTLASGSGDKTVKLWNVADGKQLRTLSGHSDFVYSVAFPPDGKTLASGSDDKTVKLWNVADGKELSTLSGHSDRVNSVAFSPDGKTLASGSFDRTVKLWRAK